MSTDIELKTQETENTESTEVVESISATEEINETTESQEETEEIAKEALYKASAKLPIKTKFIKRVG